MQFRNTVAATLVGSVLLFFAGTAAQALTLADLVAGAEVTSGNGNLTFTNFTASTSGKGMRGDLSRYAVTVLDDGIEIAGGTKKGKRGKLEIAYDVVAAAITGVALDVTSNGKGKTTGTKAFFDDGSPVGELEASAAKGNTGSDSATFSAFETLSVEETASVGKKVGRWILSNTFESSDVASSSSIPEPGTMLLLVSGVAGLAVIGRRRR